ncbi:MAG TPA: NADH-quinone oxidoreductase subunit A [Planctomycetota bacterium]|nr:NADH-quinone oxidoreductase subunit A [Planctomycetota bacterium]
MLPLLGGAFPDNGPRDYLPVLLLLIVAILVAGSQLLISWLLGPKTRPNPVKDSPYECGIEPTGEAHTRFSVKFYLVAVLFILFDIEIVFLYPWAVHFGQGAADGRGNLVRFLFAEMLVFLLILFLGWYWVVKKKALDWEEA